MSTSRHLRINFVTALFALLIALLAMVAATFAWYVYNTGAHTTKVHMAAGASASLQICNTYDGEYSSAAVLEKFNGFLNPVSTDCIAEGFQKVLGFTNGTENQPNLVANLFGPGAVYSDYYKTSLFLKTSGSKTNVYLADIGFEDSDESNPISTAIRVGFVPHEPGKDKAATGEYIFSINDEHIAVPEYNTQLGGVGHVLDASRKDGATVDFTDQLCTEKDFCDYDKTTGQVSLKDTSTSLCTIEGNGDGTYGEAVQIDVYIWLEGCDEDCTGDISGTTLKNLALSFAGFSDTTVGNP